VLPAMQQQFVNAAMWLCWKAKNTSFGLAEAQALVLCEIVGKLIALGKFKGDLARQRLDRTFLGLEQSLLLGEAINAGGSPRAVALHKGPSVVRLHYEHVACRPIAQLSSTFAAIAGGV
jgi:hypothetical protein